MTKKEIKKRKNKKRQKRTREYKVLKIVGIAVGVVVLIVIFISSVLFITWNKGPGGEREIKFSYQDGFYDHDLDLELSVRGMMIPGVTEIRYNLNGDDLFHDNVKYENSILLKVPEEGYKLYTVTAAFCYTGDKCSKANTATFVLGKNLKNDIDLDIISINSAWKNLYDYERGILVPGKTYDENKENDPEAPLVRGNYNQRTDEWIRDANVTMISKEGWKLFNQELGIQISGNTSALADVKSMKLLGNRKYGYTKIPFDFGEGIEKYNSIKLSNGGQDHWWGHVRSSLVSRLAEESGFDGHSPTKRVAVFLNGEFYGVFDAQINYSDSNIAKMFNLQNNDLVEKIKSKEAVVFEEAGINKLFDADLNVAENRDKLEAAVDMDNYLKYYALQILWQNIDWPVNNFEMWRYKGIYDSENSYTDGRWRFLIYDVDCAYYCNEYMDHDAYDFFAAMINGEQSTENTSFKNVMESDYYKNKFIEILRTLINGPFATENVLNVVDEETNKIDAQLKLWYTEEEYEAWEKEVAHLKRLIINVNDIIETDVLKFYGVKI